MQMRKFRWSRVYESAEEELVELLEHKQISARRWEAEEGKEIVLKSPADMQLWCAEGQLRCTVDGKAYSLQPGDAMDIPANLNCTIRVGLGGCACYQSTAIKKSS